MITNKKNNKQQILVILTQNSRAMEFLNFWIPVIGE